MPDISMCQNKTCSRFSECYRAQARPDPHRQSYMNFTPLDDDEGETVCQGWLEIEEHHILRSDSDG